MDQYLVFQNSTNEAKITVLDLYVYQLGLEDGNIPLSTVVGMAKSIISITLLFVVNRFSKLVREESIF
jgi:putative aldouronate transport system permease protein